MHNHATGLTAAFLRAVKGLPVLFFLVSAALTAQFALPSTGRAATVSYLGSTTYTSGGTNVSTFTLTKPAATQVTDILVAQITVKAGSITIAPPDSSWKLALNTINGTSLNQFIYYKVATDTEPGLYTWTLSQSKILVAGLSAYRGGLNDTSSTVNASSGQTSGGNNGFINAPSITTTVANTMLLAFFAGAGNITIASNTPLTNEYSLSGGGNDSSGMGYQALASTGSTGTRSAKVTRLGSANLANSGNTIGQMVALAPSPLDHFLVESVGGGALPPQTQKAPFAVQIRAVDVNGNTVTSYGGKVNIASTGTLSAGSGTTGTFVNGVLSPWSLTYSNFGTFTITATDYTIPTITGSASITVNPILDHFTVEAAAGGPITSQTTGTPFTILITARDSANGTFTGFTGTVNVASTGTLDAGGGTTPTFVGGMLTRSITIASAGSWTITTTRTGGTETGTSNTFSVGTIGDFNVFESSLPGGTVNGYIATKTAGIAFGLDVVAVNTSTNTVNTGFNDSVKVELLGSTKTGIAVGANSCPTNTADYSILQTVSSAPIANGRSGVNFAAVADVWRESRVRITYPATGTPTAIVCSDDVFAIRPSFLSVVATDGTWQSAGTSRTLNNMAATGGAVHKAGQPFTITVTAYNGAATPAVTTNYTVNYTPTPTAKTLACQLPTGCVNGTLTPGTWNVTGAGVVQTTSATYGEAGTFTLELQDLNFAADDIGDSISPAVYPTPQRGGTMGVGRFVPDHFVLAVNSTPLFKTFNTSDAGCSPPVAPDTARAFTYIGQPFGYLTAPQLLVTAQNAGNGTTINYSGTLWKINPATDVTLTYVNTPIPPDSPPPLTATLQTPNLTASGNGIGLLTASSADLLSFTRTPLIPQGAFNADISLTVNAQDSSESGVTGNGTINSTGFVQFNGASGRGIDFDSGDLFIYGQLVFPPPSPVGPATNNLTVPVEVEWYDDTAGQFFITDNDYCTPYSSMKVTLGNYTGNLLAGDTSPNGSGLMIGGVNDSNNPLYFSAPKSAHDGTVTATYTAPLWLLDNGANPAVIATFLQPPTVTEVFAPFPVLPNGASVLTITLTNQNSTPINGAAFTDFYPAGLVNTATASASTTCAGGTVTAANGGTSLALSGATIPANGSCKVTVNVTSAAAGSYTNNTGAVTTAAGTGLSAAATLVVMAPPTAAKSFSPPSAVVNAPTTVTITLTNSNPLPITGAAFTDTLPTTPGQMMVAATPNLTNSCGGTAFIAGNNKSFSLAGGNIPANSSCMVAVDITVPAPGNYTNTTGAVATANAGTGTAATAVLTASLLTPPTVIASFAPSAILVNGTSLLTVTLTNPNSTAITGAAFTDTYPAGLVNTASAAGATTCTGGTVAAASGGTSLALAGGTIPANGSCTVTVNVTSAMGGSYTNNTGSATTTNAGNGTSASAILTVYYLPNLTVVKSADKSTAKPGDTITHTILTTNSGDGTALNVVLTDVLSPYTAFSVNTFGAGIAFSFSDGPPQSGLSLGTPLYSSDNGATWSYTPVSGAGGAPVGYDGSVTNWKIPMTGTMSPAGANFTIRYQVIVK